jgi:hypothetical protein
MDTFARWLEANDLRLKAERWRRMAILLADKPAIGALNDLAAGFDKQADELEVALAALLPCASAARPAHSSG